VFSTYNLTKEWNGRVYSRIASDMFDGSLHNQLTLFGTALDNAISQTESCPDFFSNCRTNYRGVRVGAEYQGDLKLGGFGALTVGARNETERAFQSVDQPVALGGHLGLFSQQQTTNSVFALHQVTLADRLDLSVAGRVDSVVEGRTFTTGRATAAWRFSDDSGKVRASVGTGAKIPSLYQRYSTYGFAGLAPEENIGFDVGIDQPILGERFLLSATFFNNRYTNLIQFSLAPSCGPAQIFGCYYNVGKAATQGLELSAKADIAPGEWRATASYTYMDAIDKITSNGLLQRPRHKAVGSLIYTGVPDLRLEGRMTVVAGVLDFGNFAPVQLPAYYRLDAYADYKVDKNLSVFARLENLTNARYVEVYNYGVAGRSLYAGLKVDW
jgi:vitamin B12 transporter